MTCLLSVCIPTRNRRDLLLRAVDSLGILPEDVEVVISDNQSTDGTECIGFCNSCIRVIRQEALIPMAANWNCCVRASFGRYVLVLSDDDYLLPDALTVIVRRLRSDPSECGILVMSHFVERSGVDTSGRRHCIDVGTWFFGRDRVSGLEFVKACLNGFHPQFCSIVFCRSSLFPQCFDERFSYAIDVEAWLRASMAKLEIGIMSEAWSVYTLSQVNASWAIQLEQKIREEVIVTKIMMQFLLRRHQGLMGAFFPAFRRLCRQSAYLADHSIVRRMRIFLRMCFFALSEK